MENSTNPLPVVKIEPALEEVKIEPALEEVKIEAGYPVEVCSKEEGFVGSYYKAKVISRVGDKFEVEYETLVTEHNEQQPLREIVQADEVRPVPPIIQVHDFQIMQKVDAFDHEGWWAGVITCCGGNEMYFVRFDLYGVEILYHVQSLRIHQEWVNGEWSCADRALTRLSMVVFNVFADEISSFRVCFRSLNSSDIVVFVLWPAVSSLVFL